MKFESYCGGENDPFMTSFFFKIYFWNVCLYDDRTDQSWQEAKWERDRGTGSGKVLESGFELEMPVALQCCMLFALPTRLSALTTLNLIKNVEYSAIQYNTVILFCSMPFNFIVKRQC